MLHRPVMFSKNVAYRLFIFFALSIFLLLVHLPSLKHLENREQLRGFVAHLSYNPFLVLFLQAMELVSFPFWICKVIVLSLMDFPFEIVSSIRTALIVVMSARVMSG